MSKKTLQNSEQDRYHSTSIRVPLFEVDLGQAVYHGNYFHLFELARESFLRDIGYPYKCFMKEQLHLTIAKVECRYRAALYYDDRIEIYTGVSWWRGRSLGLFQKIYREGREEKPVLCTEVFFSMVCVRFTGGATSLPQAFIKCLERWAGQR